MTVFDRKFDRKNTNILVTHVIQLWTKQSTLENSTQRFDKAHNPKDDIADLI